MSTNMVSYNNDKRSNYMLVQEKSFLLEAFNSLLASVFIKRFSIDKDTYEKIVDLLIVITRRIQCCKNLNELDQIRSKYKELSYYISHFNYGK